MDHHHQQQRQQSDPTAIELIRLNKRMIRHQMSQALRLIDKACLLQQGQQVLDRLKTLKYFNDLQPSDRLSYQPPGQPPPDQSSYDRISCYKSMDSSELPTDSIIRYLLHSNKKVFLPQISMNDKSEGDEGGEKKKDEEDVTMFQKNIPLVGRPLTRMDMLELKGLVEFETGLVPFWFRKSSNPLLQFDRSQTAGLENALTKGLDIILLPGVAFDRHGNRLGHGKGYYDRFITELFDSSISRETKGEEEEDRRPRRNTKLIGLCLREQVLPVERSIPVEPHDRKLDYLITPDEILSFSSSF